MSDTCSLEALFLDLNPLGGTGGTALLEGASQANKIRVLSLAGCRLTDVCWDALAAAVTKLSSLRYVCLAANPFKQVCILPQSCSLRSYLKHFNIFNTTDIFSMLLAMQGMNSFIR